MKRRADAVSGPAAGLSDDDSLLKRVKAVLGGRNVVEPGDAQLHGLSDPSSVIVLVEMLLRCPVHEPFHPRTLASLRSAVSGLVFDSNHSGSTLSRILGSVAGDADPLRLASLLVVSNLASTASLVTLLARSDPMLPSCLHVTAIMNAVSAASATNLGWKCVTTECIAVLRGTDGLRPETPFIHPKDTISAKDVVVLKSLLTCSCDGVDVPTLLAKSAVVVRLLCSRLPVRPLPSDSHTVDVLMRVFRSILLSRWPVGESQAVSALEAAAFVNSCLPVVDGIVGAVGVDAAIHAVIQCISESFVSDPLRLWMVQCFVNCIRGCAQCQTKPNFIVHFEKKVTPHQVLHRFVGVVGGVNLVWMWVPRLRGFLIVCRVFYHISAVESMENNGNRARNAAMLAALLPLLAGAFLEVIRVMLPDPPTPRRIMDHDDPFLEALTAKEWRRTYKFQRRHIARLAAAFRLPERIATQSRHSAPRELALLWLIYRYSSGSSFLACQRVFGYHESVISRLVSVVEDHLFRHCEDTLSNFHPDLTSEENLARYSESLAENGCPVPFVWGFLDGVRWKISRPGGDNNLQYAVYSGYVAAHCLSLHVVTSTDGIIQHVHGPKPGHMNDLNVLHSSKLQEKMEGIPNFRNINGTRYKIYADGIYHTEGYIVACPRGTNLSPAQRAFNKSMSALRISVEWMIGKVYSVCSLLKRKERHFLLRDNLKKRFYVAVLLTNCHTCLYGSQASMYFDCESPNLEEYLLCMFPDV